MSQHPSNSRFQNALSREMAERWFETQELDVVRATYERRVSIPGFGGTFILDAWHEDGVALEVSTALDVQSGRFRKLATDILKLRLAADLLKDPKRGASRAVLLLPDRDDVLQAFREKWPYAAASRIDVEVATIRPTDKEYADLGIVRAAQADGQARAPVTVPGAS